MNRLVVRRRKPEPTDRPYSVTVEGDDLPSMVRLLRSALLMFEQHGDALDRFAAMSAEEQAAVVRRAQEAHGTIEFMDERPPAPPAAGGSSEPIEIPHGFEPVGGDE
jgi:hypothetical protein